MKSNVFVMGVFLLISHAVLAQDSLYTVSGQIHYPKEGDIYIGLASSDQFMNKEARPTAGMIVKALPDSAGNTLVAFSLENIPAGEYVISAFQDVNHNKKLDTGFLGPKEPYGFSGPRPRFKPKFENQKFKLNHNITDMNIELK